VTVGGMTTLTPAPGLSAGQEIDDAPTGLRSRLRIQASGDSRDRTWELLGLAVLLVGAAVLYLWNLGASGWANSYYSAAVLAGSQDWTAMLFGSLDASNSITVDKTPAALWVMSVSARVFGFSSWSVLGPQAIEGVLAVFVTYLTVRRGFGAIAGLTAGAALAVMPAAALMFRFNNPDALLTLLLVVAVYATVRAVERASTKWLVLAGTAIGFAFLTKMLQGFLIIPVLAGVYLVAAPTSPRRRVWQVAAAAIAVLVSAGWYVMLVELWPSTARPYIGGSQTNSLLELILGYNGFGRITGSEVGSIGGGNQGPGGFGSAPGLFRLFEGELASQISWLLPAALLVLLTLLWTSRMLPRTDRRRAQVLLWGGWLLVTALVFSFMQGIFHAYYSVVLAPAIGALVGIGVAEAWRHRDDFPARLIAAGIVGGTMVWAVVLLGRSPAWNPWLTPVLIGGGALAIVAVIVGRRVQPVPAVRAGILAAAVIALLASPTLGAVATASEPHTGAIPSAQPTVEGGRGNGGPGSRGFGGNGVRAPRPGLGPRDGSGATGGGQPGGPQGVPNGPAAGGSGGPAAGRGGPGGSGQRGLGGLLDTGAAPAELVAALQQGADTYDWVAATTGANNAAGLALSSGEPVMAIGGFNGTDPAPTLEQFRALVADGRIHYYVGGSDAAGFAGANGGSDSAQAISAWVGSQFSPTTIGGVTVYDLTS
jgi:4-amino-4-deoxy-L-arabinose transferase-like glycosyltransferase